MFKRLLVPYDGSRWAQTSLEVAERLAERWRADVTVLILTGADDMTVAIYDQVHDELGGPSAPTSGEHTVDVRPLVRSVPDDVAEVFGEVDDSLVVMSTRARGRTAGLAGNVSEDVLRRIHAPMLLVGHHDEIGDDWPSGQMLVCADGSDFSQTVIPLAASWADALELDPMIVGVIDPAKVPAGFGPASENNAVARMADSMGILTKRPVSYDTLHGSDPADAIVDYARGYNAAMIALATHARTGIDRVFHDSVAMAVVRRASCPVLVGHPPSDDQDD